MMSVRTIQCSVITAMLGLWPLAAAAQAPVTPTQPPAQTPTQPPTQTPTQPPTQTPTQPPAESPAQPPTQTPAETPTAGQAPIPVKLSLPLVGTATTADAATGGAATFGGTLSLEGFAEQNGQLVAVGVISGVVARSTGVAGSVLQGPVALPVSVGTATGGAPAAQAPQTCAPLHLEIGPVNLNVLGTTVPTSPVVLDISGEADSTGLLGLLVCQVPATASNPSGLAALLNQILAVLTVV